MLVCFAYGRLILFRIVCFGSCISCCAVSCCCCRLFPIVCMCVHIVVRVVSYS